MTRPIDIDLVNDGSGSFYVSERKVYPRDVRGRFDRLRTAAVAWLLGMFYGFPWLRWDGRQAVLFDLPARKFHVFGLTFWPQDFPLLALLLIIAGVSLFFFTALAGRLWCGYACPQTVWTDLFMWVERLIEGDRNARMKLDQLPWTPVKAIRKVAKHAAWLVIAAATGGAWVMYYVDAPTATHAIFSGTASSMNEAPATASSIVAAVTRSAMISAAPAGNRSSTTNCSASAMRRTRFCVAISMSTSAMRTSAPDIARHWAMPPPMYPLPMTA